MIQSEPMLALLLLVVLAQDPTWVPIPSESNRVRGAVVLPERFPEDEVCRVVLEASDSEPDDPYGMEYLDRSPAEPDPWRPVDECVLDPSCAFDLRLPTSARQVRLRVKADHLRHEPEPLRVWRDGVDPVVLRPELGTRLTVEVVLPDSLDASERDLLHVLAWGSFTGSPRSWWVGADGTVTIPGLEPNTDLSLQLDGAFSVRGGADARLGGGLESRVTLTAIPMRMLLARVLGPDGAPVDEVSVFAIDERIRESADQPFNVNQPYFTVNAGTHPDGIRVAAPTPKLVRVYVSAPGYQDREFTSDAWEEGRTPPSIDITLTPIAPIVGRILDPDGRPAAGITVEVANGAPHSLDLHTRLITDDTGGFELERPAGLPLFLSARDQSLDGGPALCLEPRPLEPGEALDHHLRPAPVLRGLVVDTEGRPYTDVELVADLYRPATPTRGLQSHGDCRANLRLDADGRFAWSGLLPGRWSVTLTADGAAPLRREVEPAFPQPAFPQPTWVLPRLATVVGQVLDPGGAPVAGARVSWRVDDRTGFVESEDDGWFQLSCPPGDRVRVSVAGREHRSVEPWQGALRGGQRLPGLTLTALPAGALHVRVVSEEGEPQKEVMLQVTHRGWPVRTDLQGRALIEGLAQGEFEVWIRGTSAAHRAGHASPRLLGVEKVQIRWGEVTELTFKIP